MRTAHGNQHTEGDRTNKHTNIKHSALTTTRTINTRQNKYYAHTNKHNNHWRDNTHQKPKSAEHHLSCTQNKQNKKEKTARHTLHRHASLCVRRTHLQLAHVRALAGAPDAGGAIPPPPLSPLPPLSHTGGARRRAVSLAVSITVPLAVSTVGHGSAAAAVAATAVGVEGRFLAPQAAFWKQNHQKKKRGEIVSLVCVRARASVRALVRDEWNVQ